MTVSAGELSLIPTIGNDKSTTLMTHTTLPADAFLQTTIADRNAITGTSNLKSTLVDRDARLDRRVMSWIHIYFLFYAVTHDIIIYPYRLHDVICLLTLHPDRSPDFSLLIYIFLRSSAAVLRTLLLLRYWLDSTHLKYPLLHILSSNRMIRYPLTPFS